MPRDSAAAVGLRAPALSLTLYLALQPAAASGADLRLGEDVAPTFQAIELELDAARPDYSGRVRIELEVKRETDRFRFHSEGLELTSLALTGEDGAVELRHSAESDDVVLVEAGSQLAPGAYILEIAFTNAFDTQAVSLYRMEARGEAYLFTQFQADDAREAFPCWDEPGFKNPFQLTLKVPEAHLAVTNTPAEKETAADGWRTVVFARTKPLPSYLLAIATGPLEAAPMPGLGVPGRLITLRGQSHLTRLAAEVTPPILKALEKYFDRPYPYAKLDFLAVPEFWPGAMENAGAVTYADRILLVDPESASVEQRRTLARVVAHELAHMWFGDLVTLQWWDDFWLNESFATWAGDKVVGEVFPQFGSGIAAVESAQGVLEQDARTSTRAIRKPVLSSKDVFDGLGLTYQKGRAVLGMFEQWLGPETFRRGVIDYVNAHAWGNAAAEDLWRALDKASGKSVSKAMATFFDQPGFPRIDVELLAGGRVKLTQERFRNHGSTSPDLTWQVPVSLQLPAGDGTRTTTVLLAEKTQTLSLGAAAPPAWVLPNAGAFGYYRWRLPAAALRALAADAGTALTPRERVELIGNVSALLAAGEIHGDGYLEVLGELAADPDPLVIRSLLGALETVEMAFVPAELEGAFAAWVRRNLGPALERFGLEKGAGEAEAVSLVRPLLYEWLGREGRDEAVLAAARSLARAYAGDASSIDPSLAGVALELAAFEGDAALLAEYQKRLESAASPGVRGRYLRALGAFADPELRLAVLRYSLEGPLRPNEIFSPVRGMRSDATGRELTYRWLTESFGQLMERMPRQFASFMPFLAGGCSAERLEHARGFFAQPEHRAQGTDRQLEKVAEQVKDCVALRQREGEAVARYLRGAVPGSQS